MEGEKAYGAGKDKIVRKQDEFSSGASSDSADIDNGSTCHVADVYRLKGGIRMKLQQTLLSLNNKRGMEMVQVAILVAIAVAIGLIFKSEITDFVNDTFGSLSKSKF